MSASKPSRGGYGTRLIITVGLGWRMFLGDGKDDVFLQLQEL
jgi:hypothetical protein